MRSASIACALTLIALTLSLLVLQRGASGGASLEPRLEVVPTLREWHASAGYFRFRAGSRIVVESTDAPSLMPTAEAIQEDVASLTGVRPMIARALNGTPGDTDAAVELQLEEVDDYRWIPFEQAGLGEDTARLAAVLSSAVTNRAAEGS